MTNKVRFVFFFASVLLLTVARSAVADPQLFTCADLEMGCRGTSFCNAHELQNESGCSADCYTGGQYEGTLECILDT